MAFWLLDWRGLLSLHAVIGGMLSGLVIPIAFFPDWARVAIWATPFPAILQAPIDIVVGRGAVLPLLAHQLAGPLPCSRRAGWCWPGRYGRW
ncbi:MAG TPA: hypothetical protein VNA67_09210 [Pseudonocardiaceae bacterium]|nr:hypothetical protein [Pseudonocardiaceae bacterium]